MRSLARFFLFFLAIGLAQAASVAYDPDSDTYRDLFLPRQDQPIDNEGGGQPPGVAEIPNRRFNGSDALPRLPDTYLTNLASPETHASHGSWQEAIQRAKDFIQDWSLEEQVALATGSGWQVGPCVGNIKSNEQRGFKGMCFQDAPTGVRYADLVNVFPAGLTTAATFDGKLAYKRGVALGEEFRAKGVNVALGPGMNIHRTAAGGRNWEMGGADPYLSGEAAFHTIHGMQSVGVQANAKHYLLNDQEHFRSQYSANVDGRTLREIYAHPFLRSIQANVTSVMCSYNRYLQEYSCQNPYLLNLLKEEMGHPGSVISDWVS